MDASSIGAGTKRQSRDTEADSNDEERLVRAPACVSLSHCHPTDHQRGGCGEKCREKEESCWPICSQVSDKRFSRLKTKQG